MQRLFTPLVLGPALLAQITTGLKLGDACPAFSLPGTDGKLHGPASAMPLLVVFLSTECPFVRGTQGRIQAYAAKYAGRVTVIGINADEEYDHGKESLAAMQAQARQQGFSFTYLKDEPQATARTFGAVCTPDFFLFDVARKLVYRGRLDDGGLDPAQVKTRDLELATEAVLSRRAVPRSRWRHGRKAPKPATPRPISRNGRRSSRSRVPRTPRCRSWRRRSWSTARSRSATFRTCRTSRR